MIDYNKLRQAHELTEKLQDKHQICVITRISISNINEGNWCDYNYSLEQDGTITRTSNIDELITKLHELAKPEPKYEVNTVVWRVDDDCPLEVMIHEVDNDASNGIMYKDSFDDWWLEEQLYPSPEELIDAQIEYWKSLKKPKDIQSTLCPKCGNMRVSGGMCWQLKCDYHEVDTPMMGTATPIKCEHKSDALTSSGIIRNCEGDIYKPFKCIKCGEFYS